VARQSRVEFPDCLDRLAFLLTALFVSSTEQVFDFWRPVSRREMVSVFAFPEKAQTLPAVGTGQPGSKGNHLAGRLANPKRPVLHPYQQNLIDFRQPP
jgi:hypothetical protein